jgi:hypothetical protein
MQSFIVERVGAVGPGGDKWRTNGSAEMTLRSSLPCKKRYSGLAAWWNLLQFATASGVVSKSIGVPFASGGDSGSVVVDKSLQAVGLVMAVAGTGEVAVVNPIEPILTRFGVSI